MTLRPITLLASLLMVACTNKSDDSSVSDDSTTTDDSADDSADDTGDPNNDISSVSIDPDSVAMYRYERIDLTLNGVKADSTNTDLTREGEWSSSDEGVVFVTPEGQIEGRAEGSATITATYGDLSDSITVDVAVFNLTGHVTLNGKSVANVPVEVQGPVDSATFYTSEVDGALNLDGLGVGTYTLTATLDEHMMSPSSYTLTLPDDEGVEPEIQILSADYPNADDHYEPDDDAASANLFAVGGPLQKHTLWTYGDEDWFSMNMIAGTEYVVYTVNLCISCDTVIQIYDTDGTTEITDNDDHNDYSRSSQVVFTPSTTGSYFLRVTAWATDSGVASYFVGADPFVDNDEDGETGLNDCDDGNSSIHGYARELAGDNVDNNCDGYSAPSGVTQDADEGSNDSASTAIELESWDGAPWEFPFQGYWVERYARTLHNETDEDWFHVSVPAHTLYILSDGQDSESVGYTVWSAQFDEPLWDSSYLYYLIQNEDDTPQDIYVQVHEGSAEGAWYYFFVEDFGQDLDQDGFYTQDWDSDRDCDDSDDSVRDECY